MGSASYIDLFASQLPVSAPQPSQHMQSRQKPVDPTDTAKLTIHPDHEATGPFGNETRMCLENEANEDWTYMTSTGDMKALPKLASCGSWGVSLPSKMNATIHIDPYIDRLNGLLHVEIESTKSPPSINVKLSRSQLAEQAKHSYLLEEHTAMRWKAWAVLASWVDHLVLRGAPPAIPPIDVGRGFSGSAAWPAPGHKTASGIRGWEKASAVWRLLFQFQFQFQFRLESRDSGEASSSCSLVFWAVGDHVLPFQCRGQSE
ncbi:hypothetical protein ColTof4_09804 [Colletotrichum tofieldiae]|nr:hypothetical protein ColTof3_05160 [Colletotrichum tofieldiae]GKT77381.1 hypothetical protein ColTof4_09804 [Colletotrichum tofieldiae]